MKICMEMVVYVDKQDDETTYDAIQRTVDTINDTGIMVDSCHHVSWFTEEEEKEQNATN